MAATDTPSRFANFSWSTRSNRPSVASLKSMYALLLTAAAPSIIVHTALMGSPPVNRLNLARRTRIISSRWRAIRSAQPRGSGAAQRWRLA